MKEKLVENKMQNVNTKEKSGMNDKEIERIRKQYQKNWFKSPDMERLYQLYPDPWRLNVDGHDRYYKLIEKIKECIPFPESILDIGCAEGAFCKILAQNFPQAKIFGIDISETALKRAAERNFSYPSIKFYCKDIGKDSLEEIPLVDAVILGEVLYYLTKTEEVVFAAKEIDNILKEGGFVFLTEGCKTKKYSNIFGEYFSLLNMSREKTRYAVMPITGRKDILWPYRLAVYRKRGNLNSEECKKIARKLKES